MERIRWCGAGALVRKGFSRPNGTFVRLLPFPASKLAGYFRRVRPGRVQRSGLTAPIAIRPNF
ncbi:MAG TPA: hypothetical protein VFU27_08235 [Terriglobales bacterium]|nr:hypothetical protein [Terriglobales bacterium]